MEYEMIAGKPVIYCVFRMTSSEFPEETVGFYSTEVNAKIKVKQIEKFGDKARISIRIVDYIPYYEGNY